MERIGGLFYVQSKVSIYISYQNDNVRSVIPVSIIFLASLPFSHWLSEM